ncbi:MAG: leucine-rich repeat domain-containing protein, partial [Clostridia bacterium]|nr:leucine-rich repeat domain-containing protein [Clostridia bacterium]
EDYILADNWVVGCKKKDVQEIYLTVDGVGAAAFANLKTLMSVRLPNAKAVGDQAFFGCGAFWEFVGSDNLRVVGIQAFNGCGKLTDVTLGKNVEKIGDYAFYGCTSLQSLALPETVKSIGMQAFHKTLFAARAEDDVIYVGKWAVGCTNTMTSDVVLKEGTIGIADYTFYNCLFIGNVTFRDTVKYIGYGAFYNCMTLAVEAFPANLKDIGDYAFFGCMYAQFGGDDFCIDLPEGLESIGTGAFYQSQVVGLTIPGTVKTIGDYAFYECQTLGLISEEIVDGEGNVVSPATNGFLTLEEGIEKIGSYAFFGCISLQGVAIPNSVTSLGDRAFYKCEGLKTLTIGSGIDTIKEYTFYNCLSLESLQIPASIQSIGRYAFRGCASITELDLAQVQHVGEFAFFNCSSLTDLTIPATLKHIDRYAFRNCDLRGTVLPTTLETLGIHAFYGNKKATFYCEAETIPAYWNERWNSSYRPVIWGCTLTEDDAYVQSFTKGEIVNPEALNGIAAPQRDGYVCVEWNVTLPDGTTQTVKPEDIVTIADGAVCTPVWMDESLVEDPEETPDVSTEPSIEPSTEVSVEPSTEATIEPSVAETTN